MPAGHATLTWLRVLRENAGVSQAQVAAILGVTPPYVSQIEMGPASWPREGREARCVLRRIGIPSDTPAPLEVLIEHLRERGIVPNPPPSDEEIKRMTTKQLRSYLRRRARSREELPEVWDELRRREAGGSDAYYAKQDPATYSLMEMVHPDGRVTVEQPPPWFAAAMAAARKERVKAHTAANAGDTPAASQRPRRRERRDSTRSTRGSPDDGEPHQHRRAT